MKIFEFLNIFDWPEQNKILDWIHLTVIITSWNLIMLRWAHGKLPLVWDARSLDGRKESIWVLFWGIICVRLPLLIAVQLLLVNDLRFDVRTNALGTVIFSAEEIFLNSFGNITGGQSCHGRYCTIKYHIVNAAPGEGGSSERFSKNP